jgi:type IX secretion system PorP/SprF family membrane protein
MKKILSFCTLFFLGIGLNAQDLSADYYSFIMNMYNVNPAYSGKTKGVSGVLNARNQVMGFSGAPKNVMAGIRSGFNDNQGVGGRLIADSRGPFSLVKADATYSYTASITNEHFLSFGMSAGFINKNFTANKIDNYEQLDQTDPTLASGYMNATRFIAGAGLLYNWKGLEVSVASPHFVQATEPFNQYIHSAVSYTHKLNDAISVMPWVSYQNIPMLQNISGFYCKGSWKEKAWVQTGYQTNKTIIASLGFEMEKFGIGYNFQFANQALKNVSSGTHQVALFFNITSNKKNIYASNASLDDIIKSLDKLLSGQNSDKSQMDIEIQKIREELLNTDVLNSDPANAEEVAKKLQIIEEKIKELEKKNE